VADCQAQSGTPDTIRDIPIRPSPSSRARARSSGSSSAGPSPGCISS